MADHNKVTWRARTGFFIRYFGLRKSSSVNRLHRSYHILQHPLSIPPCYALSHSAPHAAVAVAQCHRPPLGVAKRSPSHSAPAASHSVRAVLSRCQCWCQCWCLLRAQRTSTQTGLSLDYTDHYPRPLEHPTRYNPADKAVELRFLHLVHACTSYT